MKSRSSKIETSTTRNNIEHQGSRYQRLSFSVLRTAAQCRTREATQDSLLSWGNKQCKQTRGVSNTIFAVKLLGHERKGAQILILHHTPRFCIARCQMMAGLRPAPVPHLSALSSRSVTCCPVCYRGYGVAKAVEFFVREPWGAFDAFPVLGVDGWLTVLWFHVLVGKWWNRKLLFVLLLFFVFPAKNTSCKNI